jgi:hypothetical protein
MLTTASNCSGKEAVCPRSPTSPLPPPAVNAEVARLDGALDQVVPKKAPGANNVVGTWNLRAFTEARVYKQTSGDDERVKREQLVERGDCVDREPCAVIAQDPFVGPCGLQ